MRHRTPSAFVLAVALAVLLPAAARATPPAPLLTSIDPSTGASYEWQYDAANLGPALTLSPGSPTVVVGTIDSGAAPIPDLAGKIDSRWNVARSGKITRDTRAVDVVGHGTAVASLIAANGFGMVGFGGETHVIAMRVQTMTGAAVAAALLKLDALGARIVNMSFGSAAGEPRIVLDAIRRVERDGLLLVAAAGNSGGPVVAHPAADLQLPGGAASASLAVGASDAQGGLAFFSDSGDNLSLLAPGSYRGPCSGVLVAAPISVDFVAACAPSWTSEPGGSYAYVSGTSFAAPEVAGVAALIWAARPGLTNYQVASILKQSARRAGTRWTPAAGCGTLDAGAALELTVSRSDAQWATTPPPEGPCTALQSDG
jgi:subtilisin family serine protease